MAQRIRDGEVTSVELVETHISHIQKVNPSLNAMVVPLFDEARVAAEAADQKKRGGGELGLLHGVPISIKEFFDVRGTVTTAGIESTDATPAAEGAPLVARLRSVGAIALGKTNVPQLGIAIETENPVYGRTSNPWDIVLALAYSFVFNMLGMPAGVVPITLVVGISSRIRIQ